MAYVRKEAAGWAVHPGEVLREEFLRPIDMSVYALAKALNLPAPRLNDIVLEKRGITPKTALRLARFFGVSPEFWMNVQSAYELAVASRTEKQSVQKIRPLAAAAGQ
jgi:addiction module HigA family antidote